MAVRMPGGRPPARTGSGGAVAVPLVWLSLPHPRYRRFFGRYLICLTWAEPRQMRWSKGNCTMVPFL